MIREFLLYNMARLLTRSELCHSAEMKDAMCSIEKFDVYRSKLIENIVQATRTYGIEVRGKDVLDFGCNDGALSRQYLVQGAKSVTGVDVDAQAIKRAIAKYNDGALAFAVSTLDRIPLDDQCVDVVMSYDVFEHVSQPQAAIREIFRVLRPGGQVMIGTWGWRHPFAPHLFAVMPVPWAHMFCDERRLLSACRRVYNSSWYRPTMHDFDDHGQRLKRYNETRISPDYLNRYLIKDFERAFAASKFHCRTHLVPFQAVFARWTGLFLRVPWLREFFASYVWFVLTKPCNPNSDGLEKRRST